MRFKYLAVAVVLLSSFMARAQDLVPAPTDAAALYQFDRVWSVELRLAPEAFAAMEPAGGGNIFTVIGAMTRGTDRGPAELLAAAITKRGDQNRDGRVDRAEFSGLAARWFDVWDNTRAGALDLETLRAGLKATLDPEGTFENKFPVFLRPGEGRRNGLASAIGIDFPYVRATMAFEDATLADVGLRYKGNGTFIESRASLKRSLKLDLNHFTQGRKLAGLTKLNLHNNVTDPSGMVEPVSLRMFRDAGVPTPRTSYAQVYLTAPPKHEKTYLGLCSIVENVDKDFAKDRFGTGKGAIFKPVTPNLFADMGDSWKDFERAYDPKTDVTEAQKKRVMEFAKLMSYATESDLAAHIGEFLDLDEFARFMAVTTYVASMDSILQVGQNYFLHLDEKTGRFTFIPWDHDHSFGRIFGDQNELAKLSIHTPWVGTNRFLERMFNLPAFKATYLERLREFCDTVFSPERLASQVDELAASIRPSVEGESAGKLARFDAAVADESTAAPTPQAPTMFVKAFSRLRTQSVRDQLSGKSQGVRPRAFGPGARPAAQPGAGAGGATTQPKGRTLAGVMLERLDADHDGKVGRGEFVDGFGRWFETWAAGHEEGLTEPQLVERIRTELLAPIPGPADASSPAESRR